VCDPFLKWAGGKRWLAPMLVKAHGRSGGRLVEPFLGSGATFFALRPEQALLADANADLIDTYIGVRDHVDDVISILEGLDVTPETFAEIRAASPSTTPERAARFVYLNRTAFNGIYRVNRRGEFNVPFGCKEGTTSVDPDALRACSAALANAEIRIGDFRSSIAACGPGDFVYLDPPYTVRHNQNGFNRYNERLFSWEDQIALAAEAARLRERGAKVLVSNADHGSIRALYASDAFRIRRFKRLSRMAASTAHRGPTTEILIESR
jgi:DNA adenine methylase